MHKPIIGITHGDINGINYELLLKIFARENITDLFTPIIYGSPRIAAYYSKILGIERKHWHLIQSSRELDPNSINIIDCCGEGIIATPGELNNQSGEAALLALECATTDLNQGLIEALVTCPINKSVMPQDRFPYKGHTDYIRHVCGQGLEPLMLFTSEAKLCVALVSTHDPIDHVASVITKETILRKLRILSTTLKQDLRVFTPRIAVLALNPHAGDHGLIGSHEQNEIIPALEAAHDEGIYAFGPFAADGFWGTRSDRQYDAVLAMYHDQGLAPFKMLYLNEGVNFTAGLPVIRTSPDHGTGYDIVLQNKACEGALLQSIYSAIDLYRNRSEYLSAGRTPLPNLYQHRSSEHE